VPYAPWVFAILRELRTGEPSLAYDEAFKPMPDGLSDWGIVDDFLDGATAAHVEWLDPWFVHPYRRKPKGALIRCSHADGSESLWTGVQIEDHLPPFPNPTWGEVISWTLTSMTTLGREIATIRRSPRGPVNPIDVDLDETGSVRQENNDMTPGERPPEEGVELNAYESKSGDDGSIVAASNQSIGEPGPDSSPGRYYSEWVYEILGHLEHDGCELSAEDASSPFPGSLDWSYIRAFIDAAVDANIERLDPWFIYPDYEDLRTAVVWRSDDEGSGALWTGVSIDQLVPHDSISEPSHTWGAVIESSLENLASLSSEPDVAYVTAGEVSSGHSEKVHSEDAVRALIDEAIQSTYDRGRESGGPNVRRNNDLEHAFRELSGEDSNSKYVDFLVAYRRSAASLTGQLRLARMARSLVVGSVVGAFLVAGGGAVSNAVAWGWFDMLPYNLAGGVVLALFLGVFVIGRRMNAGHPEGESPKSVAALQLELDLLEERRVLLAAAGSRSARDRQYSYRETIPQEIERLRRETRRYRRVHNFFQWSLFVASVTMSVTAAIYDLPQPGKAILIGLGAFVSFITAVTGYFKYRERAFNLQQTADAIEQHVTAFDLAIAPYNQADETVNLERLAENVETLRVEQRKREQQLEQPHQGQQEVI
jgi:hypothetical protein